MGCLTAVPPKEAVPGKFYVLVEDTVQALGQAARAYEAKFPIPVIGEHRQAWSGTTTG
ncbi:MAG: hypothetical protein ACLUNZ_12325 [Evtepia sp.]